MVTTRRTSWITPTGQRLIRDQLQRGSGNNGGLLVRLLHRDMVPLVELRHQVGEVKDVLMAVDVRHNSKRVEERGK